MTKTKTSFIKHLDFLVSDILALQIAYYLTNLWYGHVFGSGILFGEAYRSNAWLLLLCNLFLAFADFPYKNILKRDKFAELKQMFFYICKGLALDVMMMYMLHIAGNVSRITVFAAWGVFFLIGYAFRVIWKRILRQKILHDRTDANIHVAMLATKANAEEIIRNTETNLFNKRRITGVFLLDYDLKTDGEIKVSGYPVLGNQDDLIPFVTHNWVDEVLLCLPMNHPLRAKLESEVLGMGITVNSYLMKLQKDQEDLPVSIAKYGNCVVAVKKIRSIPMIQWFLKRTLDIIGSLIGLFFTAIIFIIIAPQIYLASPGPIFFAQNRVGKNGRVFKMYKFRSMYMDAEERKAELMKQNEMNGFMFKMKDDPRIIGSEKKDKNGKPKGIGNFIRKTSLDEFPQFYNVLKGDMSLVGTRPPTLDEWKQYSESHRKRLAMRPGITGMWQVSGRSEITDFDEVVRLDSQYIDTWNIFMDLKILFMTVGQVVSHKGAE